jgi:glycosyltransferase involved in cell wall biosynthesis
VNYIETHGGQTINLRVSNTPSFGDVRAFRALLSAVKLSKPDIIHSHSSKAGVLARILPLCGIRSAQVYTPHAYYGLRPGANGLQYVYNMIESVLGRFSYTVTCSKTEQQFAVQRLRIPKACVSQVYNGVDTNAFCPATMEEKRRLRLELGLPTESRLLGFLGRSSEQKDPMTLYKAFAEVAKRQSDLALFHVGKGDLDTELNRFVAGASLSARVFRRPYMSKPRNFYRCIDAFALPSRYEGFSLAALEALACNLPLIVSRATGNTDLLSFPLSHSWSAKCGDVDGFSAAISAWLERGVQSIDINHRIIATTHFSSHRQFESVLKLYGELIGRTIEAEQELQYASQFQTTDL